MSAVPRERHEVGDPGPHRGGLETPGLGDDPRGHVPAVAPAHDPEALGVGDASCHQRVHAAHDVAVIGPAPVAVVRVAEGPAVAAAAAHVAAQDGVAASGEDRHRVDSGDARERANEDTGGSAVDDDEQGRPDAVPVTHGQGQQALDGASIRRLPGDGRGPAEVRVGEGLGAAHLRRLAQLVDLGRVGLHRPVRGVGGEAHVGPSGVERRADDHDLGLAELHRWTTRHGQREDPVDRPLRLREVDAGAVATPADQVRLLVGGEGQGGRRASGRRNQVDPGGHAPGGRHVAHHQGHLRAIGREERRGLRGCARGQGPHRPRRHLDHRDVLLRPVVGQAGRLMGEDDLPAVRRPVEVASALAVAHVCLRWAQGPHRPLPGRVGLDRHHVHPHRLVVLAHDLPVPLLLLRLLFVLRLGLRHEKRDHPTIGGVAGRGGRPLSIREHLRLAALHGQAPELRLPAAGGDEREPLAVRRPGGGARGLLAAGELHRVRSVGSGQPDLREPLALLALHPGRGHDVSHSLAVGRDRDLRHPLHLEGQLGRPGHRVGLGWRDAGHQEGDQAGSGPRAPRPRRDPSARAVTAARSHIALPPHWPLTSLPTPRDARARSAVRLPAQSNAGACPGRVGSSPDGLIPGAQGRPSR